MTFSLKPHAANRTARQTFLKEAGAKLRDASRFVGEELTQAAQNPATSEVSRDSGALQESIGFRLDGDEIIMTSDEPYAGVLEDRTQGLDRTFERNRSSIGQAVTRRLKGPVRR